MKPFAALGDSTRLQVFELLAQGEKTVGEIVQNFEFKAPTISQHLKILREAGLVLVRSEAQRRYYAINREGLEEVERWLATMTKQWNEDLDTLEIVLKQEQQRRSDS